MKALVTVENRRQYVIEGKQLTFVDDMGRMTKQQCTLAVLPVLKPGLPLVCGTDDGEVFTEGEVTSVMYRS